jgi:hypothetical protein
VLFILEPIRTYSSGEVRMGTAGERQQGWQTEVRLDIRMDARKIRGEAVIALK